MTMLDMTEEEWQRAETRDPTRAYIDVPLFNRHTKGAVACFLALVLCVMALIWWSHSDISEIIGARDKAIEAEWDRIERGWIR
jgi:hypothetical protein